ncbi:MAG: tRNA modification GTPase [Tepidisphaeraceae bacterium]
MHTCDTIVAISSAVGPAARMVVRVSGSQSVRIVASLCDSATIGASRSVVRFRGLELPLWIYRFAMGHSYTGDDLIELHLPGNPWLVQMLLDEIISRGARQAQAGEFTARAFLNHRIDLTQAEGIAAVVAANNQAELQAARRLLAGELARRLTPVRESITETLALVEADIDFSDQDISFLSRDDLGARISVAARSLRRLLDESPRFEQISHEPKIVLAGRPNAGKSTLLNALSGGQRAVVSDTPGTTRDVIWSHVELSRGIVRITDVAGIDDAPPDAGDEIAGSMARVARRAIETADVLVLIRDCTDSRPPVTMSRTPDFEVSSKCDLGRGCDGTVAVSATSGVGLEELRHRLDELAFGGACASSDGVALNARHVREVGDGCAALDRAAAVLDAGPELLAAELRDALDHIGHVLGQVSPDDLLGRIFASFCIGK